jgi:CHAD domain-containing protein
VTGYFAAVIDDALLQWHDARHRVLRKRAGRLSLHAWRVSSRRLLALEQLLAPRTMPPRDASLRHLLHHAFHASSKLRDSQVAARELQRLTPRFPAAARLARHLRNRMPRRRRRVAAAIRDVKTRTLRRISTGWRDSSTPEAFEGLARARAARRLAQAHRAVQAATRRGMADGTSIHAQRLQLKQLRYMTELCGKHARDGRPADAPAQLARRQIRLGQITDLQVLLEKIDRYGSRHPHWNRQAAPLRRAVDARRRRTMEHRERAARSR